MAGYEGTLAAVRCLGRAGIPVVVASERPGLPAAWSRWTARRVSCPDPLDAERFMDWLIDFGSREPGHVLYPTSDDLAFLVSRQRSLLASWFRLFQPPLETMLRLLDKRALVSAAQRLGFETPVTYFVDHDGDLDRIAREGRFPLLIKPRTQVMFRTRNKGVRVSRREDLAAAYGAYTRAHSYRTVLLAELPEIARPMLQEYHSEAETDTRSVAGFVDASGELFVARSARKVLQQPRRAGVGVCFEDAPLDADLATRIAALCRDTGHYGVFEAEFIFTGDRRLLIDFNPRFYNQMGLDIMRGLPLPLLAYHAALGHARALEETVAHARSPHDATWAWRHGARFKLLMAAQRLSGRASRDDVRRWRDWYAAHRGNLVDAAFDRDDPMPGLLDALAQVRPALRHPRAFLRATALY